MQTQKIVMTFKDAMNKNTTMTITDARPDVTQAEVLAVMDTILSANIFQHGGYDLVAKVDCKKLDVTETDFYNEP